MAVIKKITKLTDNRFVNLYHLQGENKRGNTSNYYVASRSKRLEDLKCKTHENPADGVIIYSLYGEKRDRVVLVRQYRYAIDGYIYEFPAGLVDEGEDFRQAAVREMHEETGLDLEPIPVGDGYEKPYFTTIGMTDESCATVYGYASGEITRNYQEENEEIEVVLADRPEVRRILKEERVSIMCSYQLMHFLKNEEPFYFLEP
ncbi:MAG TPA: NUDIX hydrolase [Candidatus Pelethocola excrementipullorum]|nr:NUDIX hydrolase [Candidatus Pelethocola excrementipullorum]